MADIGNLKIVTGRKIRGDINHQDSITIFIGDIIIVLIDLIGGSSADRSPTGNIPGGIEVCGDDESNIGLGKDGRRVTFSYNYCAGAWPPTGYG